MFLWTSSLDLCNCRVPVESSIIVYKGSLAQTLCLKLAASGILCGLQTPDKKHHKRRQRDAGNKFRTVISPLDVLSFGQRTLDMQTCMQKLQLIVDIRAASGIAVSDRAVANLCIWVNSATKCQKDGLMRHNIK